MKDLALRILQEETKGFESQSRLRDDVIDAMIRFKNETEQLTTPAVMPRFIISYKNDGFNKELFWETTAKTDVDAVDIFWKTHDVMCELISVKKV